MTPTQLPTREQRTCCAALSRAGSSSLKLVEAGRRPRLRLRARARHPVRASFIRPGVVDALREHSLAADGDIFVSTFAKSGTSLSRMSSPRRAARLARRSLSCARASCPVVLERGSPASSTAPRSASCSCCSTPATLAAARSTPRCSARRRGSSAAGCAARSPGCGGRAPSSTGTRSTRWASTARVARDDAGFRAALAGLPPAPADVAARAVFKTTRRGAPSRAPRSGSTSHQDRVHRAQPEGHVRLALPPLDRHPRCRQRRLGALRRQNLPRRARARRATGSSTRRAGGARGTRAACGAQILWLFFEGSPTPRARSARSPLPRRRRDDATLERVVARVVVRAMKKGTDDARPRARPMTTRFRKGAPAGWRKMFTDEQSAHRRQVLREDPHAPAQGGANSASEAATSRRDRKGASSPRATRSPAGRLPQRQQLPSASLRARAARLPAPAARGRRARRLRGRPALPLLPKSARTRAPAPRRAPVSRAQRKKRRRLRRIAPARHSAA